MFEVFHNFIIPKKIFFLFYCKEVKKQRKFDIVANSVDKLVVCGFHLSNFRIKRKSGFFLYEQSVMCVRVCVYKMRRAQQVTVFDLTV